MHDKGQHLTCGAKFEHAKRTIMEQHIFHFDLWKHQLCAYHYPTPLRRSSMKQFHSIDIVIVVCSFLLRILLRTLARHQHWVQAFNSYEFQRFSHLVALLTASPMLQKWHSSYSSSGTWITDIFDSRINLDAMGIMLEIILSANFGSNSVRQLNDRVGQHCMTKWTVINGGVAICTR